MVMAERRMVRAISLGVFCRLAPSTRLIIRSRKLSPGLAVTRTLIRSESTRVPPVTALRSPPASRITGADSPVMADSSTVATPSMISPSVGMISPAETRTRSSFPEQLGRDLLQGSLRLQAIGHGPGARLAKRPGLGLAPAFCHGLREIGKEHREPEPEGHLKAQSEEGSFPDLDEERKGRERRSHLGHEDDRVLQQGERVELSEGVQPLPAR